MGKSRGHVHQSWDYLKAKCGLRHLPLKLQLIILDKYSFVLDFCDDYDSPINSITATMKFLHWAAIRSQLVSLLDCGSLQEYAFRLILFKIAMATQQAFFRFPDCSIISLENKGKKTLNKQASQRVATWQKRQPGSQHHFHDADQNARLLYLSIFALQNNSFIIQIMKLQAARHSFPSKFLNSKSSFENQPKEVDNLHLQKNLHLEFEPILSGTYCW